MCIRDRPNTSSYNIWFINSTGAPTKPFAACSTITSSGCNFSNAPYNLPSGTYYIEAQANCTIGGLTPWSPPYEGYPQEASIGSRLMRVSGDEDSLDLPATTVKFSVYPNPSASQINILYYAQQNGSTDLLILNELGTTVVHKKVGTIAGQNSFSLNIGELANGVYFVKLMDGNNMHVQKLVVQK